MAGRRRRPPRQHAAAAFRPSAATAGRTPTRTQAIALLCGLVLLSGAITAVSYLLRPSKARAFALFYGSVYVDDNTSPVAIDLASGKPTVRLSNAFTAVSAQRGQDADVYPLGGHDTLLLDPATGEFNMVDSTGFVVKPSDGGVPLPRTSTPTTSTAVASGSSAYLLRTATGTGAGSTSVYLVSAATVAAATGVHSAAKPRASGSVPQRLADDPVPAAAANGDLWLLTAGAGTARTVTELRVPPRSNTGAQLIRTGHGSVSGPAAVGVATSNDDGSGPDVAAVASATGIELFRGGRTVRVPVQVQGAVDRILPSSNADGALVFLYHSRAGWSRASVATAGSTARVSRIAAIPPSAQLVVPAESDGRTYTMDTTGQGTLWQIDSAGTAETVPGAANYPLKSAERPLLADAQVVAEGSRVIFNSRANLQAVVAFSDGSHPTRVIDKHSAVQVDPSGATALADAHATGHGRHTRKSPAKTAKRPTQAINDKVNCRLAKQVPRIPTLVAGDRAARSITLSWIYTRLDPSDCYPSTFVVNIKVLSSNAPSPPSGQVTVQGQNGVTLTGLFPATEYQLSVTAYINGLGSTSAPIRVTTGPEGPAAPTGVQAVTDSSGNWTVSWKSCGGIAQGCVPSTTWYVIPSFCDGQGLSNVPARLTVPGDPTVHQFSHLYPGGDALLGRALCFQVQGVSPQGVVGDTSARSAPAYSWTTPNVAAMTLAASQPGNVAFGATTSTTVDLDLGANPVRDTGGIGAGITLRLTGPDGTTTKTVVWDGREQRVSAQFTGIRAGAQYSATASIAPPNHPSSAVSEGPVAVTTRAQWPDITAQASCPPDSSGGVTLSCTLSVRLSGPSSAQANGERFDLVDSEVVCQSSGFPLTASGIDPSRDAITQSVDLLKFNGSCTVNVHLVEAGGAAGVKVFGGTESPLVSRSVDLGRASAIGASRNDFSATFDPSNPTVTIHYAGDHGAAGRLSFDWHEQLYAPDGTPCGGDNAGQGGQPDVTLDIRPLDSCAVTQGDQTGWYFTISYRDLRDSTQHAFTNIAIPGKPSGFIPPCSISAGDFAATWSGTSDAPSVTVTFNASPGTDLRGCSGFSYVVQEPATSRTCASAQEGDPPPASTDLSTVDCQHDLTLPGNWHVHVGYSSARHDERPIDVTVAGSPPTPTPPTPTPSDTPSPTGS